MYETPTMHHRNKITDARLQRSDTAWVTWQLIAVTVVGILVSSLWFSIGHVFGYSKAQAELGKQPRIWRCVLDPRDIASGVPDQVILPATRPEIALRTARERAQWGDRRAYVQPMIENYPEILSIRVTP